MIKQILNLSNDFETKEEIILRDFLALERTKLANERTLLTYTRTSLYLLLAGIAILQLQGFDSIKWIGFLSIVLSILLIMIGVVRFYHLKSSLKKHYRTIKSTSNN